MKNVKHLRCLICGKKYLPNEVDLVCPEHGSEGILEVAYDYDRIGTCITREDLASSTDWTIWRYRPLLPVHPDSPTPPLPVGWTPMCPVPTVEKSYGLAQVWVKDDGRQPSGSLKDRASAIAVVKAREIGADTITTASTGNAAAALSALCASVQQPNVIFVPVSAPEAKIAQLLAYGSTVLLVDGTYDEAFDLCLQASAEFGWYNRNTGFNPYMSEGKKTVAFEICEQLRWEPPDVVLVSVGDGCIIGGMHKGMKDLEALGWIGRIPRLIGVQAEGSSYLTQAWQNGEDVLEKPAGTARTIADSICVGLPRDRLKAMAAVQESDGEFISVSDERIMAAILDLARCSGVFAEPAAAAAWAGLLKSLEDGLIGPGERVVVLNTGTGLKDVSGIMKAVDSSDTRARRVSPDMDSLRRVMARD